MPITAGKDYRLNSIAGSAGGIAGLLAGDQARDRQHESIRAQEDQMLLGQKIRREDYDYRLTAEQKSEQEKLANARWKIETSQDLSESDRSEALRRLDLQEAGIKPYPRLKDPETPVYPEGQGPGKSWVDPDTKHFMGGEVDAQGNYRVKVLKENQQVVTPADMLKAADLALKLSTIEGEVNSDLYEKNYQKIVQGLNQGMGTGGASGGETGTVPPPPGAEPQAPPEQQTKLQALEQQFPAIFNVGKRILAPMVGETKQEPTPAPQAEGMAPNQPTANPDYGIEERPGQKGTSVRKTPGLVMKGFNRKGDPIDIYKVDGQKKSLKKQQDVEQKEVKYTDPALSTAKWLLEKFEVPDPDLRGAMEQLSVATQKGDLAGKIAALDTIKEATGRVMKGNPELADEINYENTLSDIGADESLTAEEKNRKLKRLREETDKKKKMIIEKRITEDKQKETEDFKKRMKKRKYIPRFPRI